MKELLLPKDRHLLWQDETGEEFVLLKMVEVFIYSDTALKVHTWSNHFYRKCRKMMPIFNEDSTDDPLWVFCTDRSNLRLLMPIKQGSKRKRLRGKWIQEAEKRLAHKILPCRPRMLKKGENK